MPELNQTQKLHGLDHLRALAILLVFLFHYLILTKDSPEWMREFSKFGWTGVDLFFVVSGFLISSQLFVQIKNGQLISFKNFFLKRFFRIVPLFLVTLAIYFCFPFFHEKESMPPLWRFLTFTQNFGLDIKANGTFSHAWSLCVEEHFYLFLPLILILLQYMKLLKRGFWLIIALFLFGFFIRDYSFYHLYVPRMESDFPWMYWYKYVYYPTYNRLDGLLVGVSIAAIYNFLPVFWSKISRCGNILILIGLVILTGAYFFCEDQRGFAASVFGFPLIALGYGFLVAGAISPNSFLYKWKSRVTTFLAMLSYGIYLTHKGIVHMTQVLLEDYHVGSTWTLVICFLVCVFAALILNFVVEKPFMKVRNIFLSSNDKALIKSS